MAFFENIIGGIGGALGQVAQNPLNIFTLPFNLLSGGVSGLDSLLGGPLQMLGSAAKIIFWLIVLSLIVNILIKLISALRGSRTRPDYESAYY